LASFDWAKNEVLIEIKGENGHIHAQQTIPLSRK
jgi:hypothetical protein